jgi:hypothetical protein
MFEVTNDERRRTITVRMSGFMQPEEMTRFSEAYRQATDAYRGERHLVLADMRGLKALPPESTAIFGEAIGYARPRGVALCAHLSDSTIQRLQAARLAHQAAPGDDVTVDCVSLEAAENQLGRARVALFGSALSAF